MKARAPASSSGTGNLRVVSLVDDAVAAPGLIAEHGLAWWIETPRGRVLFDTGAGEALLPNARALGVDLAAADAVALSHGHHDHTGGLAALAATTQRGLSVVAHPDAKRARYRCTDDGAREIGLPAACRAAFDTGRLLWQASRESVEVAPGLWLTGEIPRRHPGEAATERFARDLDCTEADPFMDDQALFAETGRGSVVLLGCAHAGVVNTLDAVQALTAGAPVRAVLGGTHLRSADAARLAWTARQLARFGLETLVPTHCTGEGAGAALCAAFPAAFRAGGAGSVFVFQA